MPELDELSESVEALTDVPVVFDEEGKPSIGFRVVGVNSKDYQTAARAFDVLSVKRVGNRGRPINMATDEGAKDVVVANEKRKVAIACACAKEVYGLTVGGQPAKADVETLTAIFKKRPSWLNKVVLAVETDDLFQSG